MIKMPPVQTQYFAFNGGLDQVTPPIQVRNGTLRYGTNVEIGIRGGYGRCAGYERYNGMARPSDAQYAVLPVTLTGSVAVGDVLTNDAGTIYGTVIAMEEDPDQIILTNITGAFVSGTLRVAGISVGTATSGQQVAGAATPSLDASYLSDAADVYRALISAVPGSGSVLGVHQYGSEVYAFRNNAAGTAAAMYRASTAGWALVPLGTEIGFAQRSATVTITIASPGVVTWVGHGLQAGRAVSFTTTGLLPTGFLVGVQYYVVSPTADTFELAATVGGASINTSGSQSGVHTGYLTATEIVDGDTITGLTSGTTATARRVLLSDNTWGTDAAGSLVLGSVVGAFVSGEALTVGGITTVNTVGIESAITLLPNGRYEFENWNFGGQAGTNRMYGCDGVNPGFEFDGDIFAPIHTGMTLDNPKFLRIHKNHLFFAFASSVQHSGTGNPYTWNPIFGAAELTVGDTITNLLELPGVEGGGAMSIYTRNRLAVLYGNDVGDWNLVFFSYESGGFEYTAQYVRNGIAMDTQGITTLASTQRYGNFIGATISDQITPYLNDKITQAVASCIVRRKNQYRLFFSTGDAVFVTYGGDKILGMTTMLFPHKVTCISSMEGASGREEIYFGSDDGFVRQMEVGRSFDGQSIAWNASLSFNHFQGPRQLKTFRKTVLEVMGDGYFEFGFSTSLSYESSEFAPAETQSLNNDAQIVRWDGFYWDRFFWDGRLLSPSEADTVGTAENISLLFSGDSADFLPFTLYSAIMHYTPRRLLR